MENRAELKTSHVNQSPAPAQAAVQEEIPSVECAEGSLLQTLRDEFL